MSLQYGSAGTSPSSISRSTHELIRKGPLRRHRGRLRVRVGPVLPPPASREREWRGWLFRTAEREAWRLNAQHHDERPMLHDTDV